LQKGWARKALPEAKRRAALQQQPGAAKSLE
jgi:hypothetical protein